MQKEKHITLFVNMNIHRKSPVLESLFNKAAGLHRRTLLKRDSSIGVFQLILQNFKYSFFYRTLTVAASKWGNGKS